MSLEEAAMSRERSRSPTLVPPVWRQSRATAQLGLGLGHAVAPNGEIQQLQTKLRDMVMKLRISQDALQLLWQQSEANAARLNYMTHSTDIQALRTALTEWRQDEGRSSPDIDDVDE